jgi:predicted O-linked N-acetylglucosamine transferase (SPINDLY family)
MLCVSILMPSSNTEVVSTHSHPDVNIEPLLNLFFEKKYDVLTQQLKPLLALHPDWLTGWKILSDTYLVQQKDARVPAKQALLLNQQDPKEHCYYGLVLKNQNDLVGAAQAFEQAVLLKSDYVEALNNLGIVYKDMGNYALGIDYFKRALELAPNYASCFSNLLFCLSHDDSVNTLDLFDTHLYYAQLYEQPARWPKHSNLKAPGRVLNIGMVSSCFREHSLSNFLLPILPYLQQIPSLNLYAYACSPIADEATTKLKAHFQHWQQVDQLNDSALADKIRADKIDILLDLDGHTSDNRLTMFALKPVPIQVSWLGYLATTGLSAMDYYLGDNYLLPEKQLDKQFSEKLVQLPVNAPFVPSPLSPAINALPAIKNGYITFACFNRVNKINQSTVQLWSQILKRNPRAKLLLIADIDSGNHNILLSWFQQYGTQHQLIFKPRASMQNYLALHHEVDICLDTMPSNGVTTTCHAAWMGVPTLCIAGSRMSSRGAQAIMQHLGLNQFIAKDTDSYAALSQDISEHLIELSEVRMQLRQRFEQSRLAQGKLAAESLNHAFRQMWKRWCSGKQAKSFSLNP